MQHPTSHRFEFNIKGASSYVKNYKNKHVNTDQLPFGIAKLLPTRHPALLRHVLARCRNTEL